MHFGTYPYLKGTFDEFASELKLLKLIPKLKLIDSFNSALGMWLDIRNPNKEETPAVNSERSENNCKDTLSKNIKEFFFAEKRMPDLILDYDVIGFDVDHTLVKYNVVEFAKLICRSFFEDMH